MGVNHRAQRCHAATIVGGGYSVLTRWQPVLSQ